MPLESVAFSTDLYSTEAIAASADAFAGLATIRVEVSENGAEARVSFADIREDVRDALLDEFCNHVLSGTVERRRLAAI